MVGKGLIISCFRVSNLQGSWVKSPTHIHPHHKNPNLPRRLLFILKTLTHGGEHKQRETEAQRENGFGVRDLCQEGNCGRTTPHAGEAGIDRGERTSEWAEGGGGAVRGDLHLRWARQAEDEVLAFPPQAHEHQALSRPHPFPCTRQDLLAHRSWVSTVTLFFL